MMPMAEIWDPYRRVKMESTTVKSAGTEISTITTTTAAMVARCAGRRRRPHRCWNRHHLPNGTITALSRAITACTTWRWTDTSLRRRQNDTRRALRRSAARITTRTSTITTITTTTNTNNSNCTTNGLSSRATGTPRPHVTVQQEVPGVAAAVTPIYRCRGVRLKTLCHRRRRWPKGSTTPHVTTIVTTLTPPNATNPFIRGEHARLNIIFYSSIVISYIKLSLVIHNNFFINASIQNRLKFIGEWNYRIKNLFILW